MRNCETCNIDKEDIEFSGGRKHCKKCNRQKYYDKVKNNHYQSDCLKTCTSCGHEKESIEFRIHKSYCKKCENKKTYESRKETQSIKNKEYLKIYQKKNKDIINERMRSYNKVRIKSDPIYKLSRTMSRIINNSIRLYGTSKTKSSIETIGLSPSDFVSYLESKFEPWMNWDNHGLYNGEINYGWDIDHIVPLSSATSVDELYKLNHYTNLQPMCSYTNRYIKKDNTDYNI